MFVVERDGWGSDSPLQSGIRLGSEGFSHTPPYGGTRSLGATRVPDPVGTAEFVEV
jgi:hypothetical protein